MSFFTELTCPSLFQGIPLVNKLKKAQSMPNKKKEANSCTSFGFKGKKKSVNTLGSMYVI